MKPRYSVTPNFVGHHNEDKEDLQNTLHDGDNAIVGGACNKAIEHAIAQDTTQHAACCKVGDDAPIDAYGVAATFDDAYGGHDQDGDG